MSFPAAYDDIRRAGAPKMIQEAIRLYGTLETPGPANNPVIMDMAKSLGIPEYTSDSIAWCGLLMGHLAKVAGKDLSMFLKPRDMLWALNWSKFGNPVSTPMLGDVIVFKRNGGGHVALYVGEDSGAFHVLGGNQSDQINIIRNPKSKAVAFRRPAYNIQPASVQRIMRASSGTIFNDKG